MQLDLVSSIFDNRLPEDTDLTVHSSTRRPGSASYAAVFSVADRSYVSGPAPARQPGTVSVDTLRPLLFTEFQLASHEEALK